MAEIPPAGGPADVSSMLDAWLAEDQGAVAGDWSLVEPGTVPAPAEQPAGAVEALPAAVPLPDAAGAGGVDAAAGGWAPVPDAASTATDLQVEAAAEATVRDTAAADVADPAVVDGVSADASSPGLEIDAGPAGDRAVFDGAPEERRDIPPDEQVPLSDIAPALSELAIEPRSGLAAGEEPDAVSLPAEPPAGAGDMPLAPTPACDAWLAEGQAPGQDAWTTLEADPRAVPESLEADEAQTAPPAAAAAAPVVEGTVSWLSEAQGDEGNDWTSIEPSASEAIAPAPLETERAAVSEAPNVDPLQAAPPAAGPAVTGIDAWLNDGQGMDSGWSSAEPAAVRTAAPPSVAPEAAPSAVEAAPPSASLLEAVSALDARGGDAAQPETPPAGAAPQRAVQDRYVLFTVAGAQYAVQETFVTELDRVPKITTVPNVPAWVRGVTNRRGDILSVIEIRGLLGLERIAVANERMLVVRLLDESCSLGLLVDAVQQIVTVAAEDIRPPAAMLEGVLAPFLGGVFEFNGKAVAVLDLDRMLRSEPVRQFDEPPDAAEG